MFTLTLDGGTKLGRKGLFACLDCGLVWSSTQPDKLADFIQKHCNTPSALTNRRSQCRLPLEGFAGP